MDTGIQFQNRSNEDQVREAIRDMVDGECSNDEALSAVRNGLPQFWPQRTPAAAQGARATARPWHTSEWRTITGRWLEDETQMWSVAASQQILARLEVVA